MALTDSLRILITANGAQAEREFSKVGAAARRSLGQAEAGAQKFGRQLTSAGVAMATFGGVALIGLYKAAQAADEENRAILQLQNSIDNSPALVGASTAAFLEQAAALQDVTTFADDATIAAQAMLATFRLSEDQILALTPLTQDLAAKFGVDLTTAATAVGKAMQGNTGTLRRWGVFIEEGATQAETFDNVLAGLRENAGGFAEQEGATFSGQLTIMKNNLGDVAEGIGQGVISAFNDLMGPVLAVSGAFERLNPESQALVGRIATFGSVGLIAAGGISFLTGQVLLGIGRFKALGDAMLAARIAMMGMGGVFAPLVAGIAAIAIVGDQLSTPSQVENFIGDLTGDDADIRAVAEEIAGAANATTNYGRAGALARVTNDELERIVAAMGELDPAGARELGDALIELGVDADVVAAALDAIPEMTQADRAARRVENLAEEAEDAAAAADLLERRWSGLNNSLSQFDAVTGARRALQDMSTSFQEATDDGSITADEMLGLRDNLSNLVQSYRDVARAQNTNRDGVVDVRAANQQLRDTLGGLAAFIPAELRPQFNELTADINRVPRNPNVNVTETGAASVQRAIDQINKAMDKIDGKRATVYLDAELGAGVGDFLRASNPDRELARTVAPRGGGTPTPPAGGLTIGVVEGEIIGRAVAKELRRQPLMTVGVG